MRLRVGEVLFRKGEPADALCLLTSGSITVTAGGTTRSMSFSPGAEFGELALLAGGVRSATAVADQAPVPRRPKPSALAGLAADDPVLAALLYQRLALHLAVRLRHVSDTWRQVTA